MSRDASKRVRLVLKAGAAVFGLSALALIATPSLFNSLLGLDSTDALDWSMRMTGITLVALSGNMYSHSTKGTPESVIRTGRVMLVSAFALGVLTLLIPSALTPFAILYAIVGFGFATAYAIALWKN